ncbi:hypothetical protein AAJP47_04545 [Psychrobacter sp. B38]|uniref:hypothetical protein n=1 Tax=Psychrobacter sp. B38 TaxID=3143538 RepID=UPI00320E9DC2
MNNASKELDDQEQEIQELAADINPREDKTPDSLAEATTAPLSDDDLGESAADKNVKK